MSIDHTINRLYRERNLALRRLYAHKLISKEERDRLKRKLLSKTEKLTRVESRTLFDSITQEGLTPPPTTPLDFELWALGRSLEEIDCDLAAIPPPTVEVLNHPVANCGSGFSHYAAFETSIHVRDPEALQTYQVYFTNRNLSLPDSFLNGWAKGKTRAVGSVVCTLSQRGGPRRSLLDIHERQNHDGYMVGYGGESPLFGRHFSLDLRLSVPLWSALRSCLSGSVEGRIDGSIGGVIVVPVHSPLEGRPIAVGSQEPYLETLDLPCKELVVLPVLGQGPAGTVYGERYLREGP